ncbi:hypothetical protein KBD20_02400 [Candidatus Saccharibacteria bacterium]|nr:hypothetical protein [Candidatus Saccharibacteria bacterium]
MTFEHSPQNPEGPSKSEQEALLMPLLAANMQRILMDREFFARLKERHSETHPKAKDSGDRTVGVAHNRYERRLADGSQENGEAMMVGFKTAWGDGTATTSYVHVLKRIDTESGTEIRVEPGFTQEDAEMVADMVDDLMLAKTSGQIPNLHEMDLTHIYIPSPHDEYLDF